MKLCSRLLMVSVEISAKNDKFGYLNLLGRGGHHVGLPFGVTTFLVCLEDLNLSSC